ncbi:MAG: hypothetical protein J5759_00125 [Bacteroidales bacterium]|nr:hypothetical protein [Bacteroidales bacterium]
MGIFKNILGDAVSQGIGNALGKAVEKAVAPAAERFANKQAEAIDDATRRTDEAMKQTAAAMDQAQKDLDAAAAGEPAAAKPAEGAPAGAAPEARPLTEEERKQAAEASAALKGFGMMFSGAIAQAKKEAEEEQAKKKAAEEAIFTDWEKNLPAFPKWDVGGSNFELEEDTPMNGYPVFRLSLQGRPFLMEAYAQKIRSAGFVARGCSNPLDLNADTYYKIIDGVCWNWNRSDACCDGHITTSFYVDNPPKPVQPSRSSSSSSSLEGLAKGLFKKILK